MNRITLAIAGLLLASGTYTMAYGADRDKDKVAFAHETRQDAPRHDDHDASRTDKRDSSREDDSHHSMTNGTSREVKLTNQSNLTIRDIDVKLSGRDAKDFHQTNNCGDKLDGGGSCTISVTFQPRSTGDKSATMEVQTSGGNQIVNLSGSGT